MFIYIEFPSVSMVRRVIHRRLKIVSVLVLVAGATFLLWNWRNEEKRSFKVRFEEIVDFGFEAFTSNDWYNAEGILSSLFDKRGNSLNLFYKMDKRRRLKARSLYGYLLFCKGNFKKSEAVWRPIFAKLKILEDFAASRKSQYNELLFYLRDLSELKKFREIFRVFNFCYDENGAPSEILQKFGDSPLMRSMAGESFCRNAEYSKSLAVLKVFFENPAMLAELSDRQKAMVQWHYGKSLLCEKSSNEEKQYTAEEIPVETHSAEENRSVNDIALTVLAPFFDKNAKATKLLNELDEEDQISCRTTYAQLLLKSDDYEKILKLLEVFFDENGELVLKFKHPSEEIISRNMYGYSLCRCGKYTKARKVWSRCFEESDKELMKNLSADEIDLLKALRRNIRYLSDRDRSHYTNF